MAEQTVPRSRLGDLSPYVLKKNPPITPFTQRDSTPSLDLVRIVRLVRTFLQQQKTPETYVPTAHTPSSQRSVCPSRNPIGTGRVPRFVPAYSGFPVELAGVRALDAAFLNESRTVICTFATCYALW